MCDYFDILNVDYTYYVNDNRVHGFNLNPDMLSGFLVVAADFAIDRDTLKRIVDAGVDIVSTDHHEIESEFIEYDNGKNRGVVLNNQYPFEPEEERYNSGAGVIYNLFKEFMPEFKTLERDAIIGITLLSDVRPIENKKARNYLAKLYSYNEGYIDYLIQNTLRNDFGFGVPKMDRNYVDFTFSPTINAMLRFNKTQVAVDLILGKGLTDTTDYRTMQSNLVRVLKNDAEVLDLGSCVVLAVNADNYVEDVTNFIGLLCSAYKNKGTSALAFAYSGGKIKRASFRGKYDNIDYRGSLCKLGVNAQGHMGAFGIKEFYPNANTWKQIAEMIHNLELGYQDTRVIIESNNLSVSILNKGSSYAYENCYVRDMYRTYIHYTGKNIKEVRKSYRMIEFEMDDYVKGRKPDKIVRNKYYKFELDENGNKIVKYQEFNIDGKTVKSFSQANTEKLLILPILEKGYLNLYLV